MTNTNWSEIATGSVDADDVARLPVIRGEKIFPGLLLEIGARGHLKIQKTAGQGVDRFVALDNRGQSVSEPSVVAVRGRGWARYLDLNDEGGDVWLRVNDASFGGAEKPVYSLSDGTVTTGAVPNVRNPVKIGSTTGDAKTVDGVAFIPVRLRARKD